MANDNAHGGAWDCHPGIKPPDWKFQYQAIGDDEAKFLETHFKQGPTIKADEYQLYRPALCPVPPEMKQRIAVNKQTHRIRFEDETEHSVTVVIEPKVEP